MSFRNLVVAVGVLGLGAVAEAVFPVAMSAQVPVRRDTVSNKKDTARTRVDTAGGRVNLPPAKRDTIRIPVPAGADSMIRNDSIIHGIIPFPPVKVDTVKPPIARAEAPPILEIGEQRIYDRAAIYATGAYNLADLLARVPGLTEFSTGFLASPTVVASQGDFKRIRVFLDGIALDPLDRRARGTTPVNDLPLHALEELRIERGAEEVRVYARTWRVDRTDPYTRADIFTGDQNTNLFRAYFGRRYDHGEILQFSADYANTQPQNQLPSSDAVNAMGRVGLTHGPWSLDGFFERTGRNRGTWIGTGNPSDQKDTVPGIAISRVTSYLRFGNGDPDTGKWFQMIASSNEYHAHIPATNSLTTTTAVTDSLTALSDSTSYVSQYVITGGERRGNLSVSALERMRVGGGRTSHGLSGRASFTSTRLSVSGFGEGRTYLDPSRLEATVRIAPVGRFAVTAVASRTGAGTLSRLLTEPIGGSRLDENGIFVPIGSGKLTDADTAEASRYTVPARTNTRLEAGFKFRDLWLSAGAIHRGATTLLAPAEFGGRYTSPNAVSVEGEATATTLAARGHVYRAVNIDASAIKWSDTTGFYRPRYQTRAELYLQTNLLDRFPKGNFGILGSLAHEYRSSSQFPIAGDTIRTAPGYRMLTFKLEIRIQTAVISYQFRNLLQEQYSQVPGFNLPRQTQFYGVRWDFWN